MVLHSGDRVAVIAPAAAAPAADSAQLDAAAALLGTWGLRVDVRVGTPNHFYLAGSDRVRAEHLHRALADDDTRAIFCARGGYGTTRLYGLLDHKLAPAPKIVIGYSDVTALHLAAEKLWPQLELIHGPNIATRQFLGCEPAAEKNREALHNAVFDLGYQVDEPVEFLRLGTARGRLTGGCLSLLASSLGSAFAPRTDSTILLIEDTKEAPYRIDRMLIQLRNAGLLANVAGVVFGAMHECSDGITDLRAIIADVFAGSAFPLAFGLRAGHGQTNIALSLGATAVLDSARGRFRLLPRD